MNRLGIAALVAACVCAVQTKADAFCGFYVAGGDQQMFNDATQVVLMRHGTRTVMSMQNNYKGPPSAFAMVIPVPVVLKEGDVKTLSKDAFAAVERMGAPRLVEYWEVDPCFVQPPERDMMVTKSATGGIGTGRGYGAADLGVKVEAKFVVGEYQIVILSAKDSTGLDTWLRQEKYNIPAGAEPLLRPYVESGQKFFVAKVDPTKVKFEGDRAVLSPLRFHYESDQFNLPIRLGLANSSGKQDLIVNILAPNQRYEVSNYKNVTIPTNITVADSVKEKFGAFYTALFDATIEKNPGAVVTEYAWQAIGCDPCPGPMLDQSVLTTLGLDVIEGVKGTAPPSPNMGRGRGGWGGPGGSGLAMNMVLTRLHARYGKDITNDLEFKAAPGIVGGREFVIDAQTHPGAGLPRQAPALEEGAQPSSMNNFQGRYAIRHAWEGPIACNAPVRNRWGGPWQGIAAAPTTPALDLAFAPRGGIQLAAEVKQDVPELGIKFGTLATMTPPPKTPPQTPTQAPASPGEAPKQKSGCGCGTTGDASPWLGVGLAALLLRRRRRAA
jgi:MYXO-CTERM domain-containing protein